jgi:hypothetical protein
LLASSNCSFSSFALRRRVRADVNNMFTYQADVNNILVT